MRITQIEVKSLFDMFDHRITVHNPVTIIHGPNGVGKTVLLQMIYDFMNGDFQRVQSIPFESLIISFDTGFRISCQKTHEGLAVNLSSVPKSIQTESKVSKTAFKLHSNDVMSQLLSLGYPMVKGADGTWRDSSSGAELNPELMSKLYKEMTSGRKLSEDRELERVTRAIRGSVNVIMVDTRRLEVRRARPADGPEGEAQPAIVRHAWTLKAAIQKSINEYASNAQELDRTFPFRLIKKVAPVKSRSEIGVLLRDLDQKRNYIQSLGVLDSDPAEQSFATFSAEEIQENAGALSVYLDDTKRKLEVFDDLIRKLEIFSKYVSRRFQWKEMKFDKQEGIVFYRKTQSGSDTPILLRNLSSGEQHIVVLILSLLFNTKKGTLVLIDEPELSLNLAWQEDFLDDLIPMLQSQSCTAIVATHSAQVIGSHWNLVGSLRGPIV